MHRPNLRIIGLLTLLIALAFYRFSNHWIETRHYLIVDAPLSLAVGETTYTLQVQQEGNYNLSLLVWPKEEVPVRVAWSITGGHDVLESGAKEVWLSRETYIGRGRLKPGNYTLKFKVLDDFHRLNNFSPRIAVNADNETYDTASRRYDYLVTLSGAFGVVGTVLFLFSFRRKPLEMQLPNGAAIDSPDTVKRFPGYDRRLSLVSFSYIGAVFFALLLAIMLFMSGAFRYTPRGLWVRLLQPSSPPESADKWQPPIIVRVTATRQAPAKKGTSYFPYPYDRHYFINNEEVPANQLKPKLKELLVTRSDRTVYVEGDGDSLVYWIFHVVDVAKGAYASRVVLLTTEKGLTTVPSKHTLR
ncbi:MAG TPA: biopolymer transporter ExbD [Terriglobales bacterium]|nr:biopolymer transporter ExbD [Terriglobales bacterium]